MYLLMALMGGTVKSGAPSDLVGEPARRKLGMRNTEIFQHQQNAALEKTENQPQTSHIPRRRDGRRAPKTLDIKRTGNQNKAIIWDKNAK